MKTDMGALVRAELAGIEARAAALAKPISAPLTEDLGGPTEVGSFAATMGNALRAVNEQDAAAGRLVEAVERGESDDLVGAMLESQKASLSFSMLMQVRNKVMGAFEELVKLPL